MLAGIKQKRERLQQEDSDLEFEERLVEQAISRKARRTSSASGGRVTRDQVFQIVSAGVGRHFKAPEAMEAMKAQGVTTMAAESLRQHLRRLVQDERFGRDGDYYLNPTVPESPPTASNGNGQATQAFSDAGGTAEERGREIGIQHGSP
jgi:hypothetical protein